jgi:hypothetical protein
MKILKSFSAVVLAGALAMIATSVSFAAVNKQAPVEPTATMKSAHNNNAKRPQRRTSHTKRMAHMTRRNGRLTRVVPKKKSLTNESY